MKTRFNTLGTLVIVTALSVAIGSPCLVETVRAATEALGPLELFRIEPSTASTTLTTVVELRGRNFVEGTAVYFGESRADILLEDTAGEIDRILAFVPQRLDTTDVDVRIVDPNDGSRQAVSRVANGGGFHYTQSIGSLPLITGVVSDAGTGNPLIGAHVRVSPGNMAAISGVHGEFVVVVPSAGTYSLRCETAGYAPRTQSERVRPSETLHRVLVRLTRMQSQINDVDGDGLTDDDERGVYGTDPENPDTDTDGIDDGREVAAGMNPKDFFDGDIVRGTDVDGSGAPDAVDLQLVANTVLGLGSPVVVRTDVDGNRVCDSVDIQWVVNAILGKYGAVWAIEGPPGS